MASQIHHILQFRLQAYSLTVANSALKEIERILLHHGLQDEVIETIRSNVKAMSILITESERSVNCCANVNVIYISTGIQQKCIRVD